MATRYSLQPCSVLRKLTSPGPEHNGSFFNCQFSGASQRGLVCYWPLARGALEAALTSKARFTGFIKYWQV